MPWYREVVLNAPKDFRSVEVSVQRETTSCTEQKSHKGITEKTKRHLFAKNYSCPQSKTSCMSVAGSG